MKMNKFMGCLSLYAGFGWMIFTALDLTHAPYWTVSPTLALTNALYFSVKLSIGAVIAVVGIEWIYPIKGKER